MMRKAKSVWSRCRSFRPLAADRRISSSWAEDAAFLDHDDDDDDGVDDDDVDVDVDAEYDDDDDDDYEYDYDVEDYVDDVNAVYCLKIVNKSAKTINF